MRVPRGGLLVGLAGLAAFGWGLFNLIKIGSCGGDGAPPCPPGSWPYFLAVTGGLVAAIGSTFAPGGGPVFLGIFLTVGIASLAAGLDGGTAGDTTFPIVFGGLFLLVGLAPLLLLPLGARRMRRAKRLVTGGLTGIATVADVEDTGVTINDNPRVRVRLQVEPQRGGSPFEAHKTMTVSRVEIPRKGDRFPVWYDADDPDGLVLGTDVKADAPADVRALFAKAGHTVDGAPAAAEPVAAADGKPPASWVEELGALNDLRLKGVLTDEEFATAKARLLDRAS